MTATRKALGPSAPRLYLLMTRSLCAREPELVLREALRGGVGMVQLREKPFVDADASWIDRAAAICAEHGAPCIVNDAARFAARADGLHLGQEDLEAFEAGSWRERSCLLGISTHDPAEFARAALEAPDYVGVGPCAPTTTKGYSAGLTEARLRALLAAAGELPAYAIGGITPGNLPGLIAHGVRRIAVSSAILCAENPHRASLALRELLERTPDG